MNWSVPPLIQAPYPGKPHWLWWGIALLLMLVGGFFLAVSVMPDEELRDKTHLLLVAAGGPFLLWCLALGARLMVHDIVVSGIHARNETVLLRQQQWKAWAGQSLGLLAWGRQTGLGPREITQIMSDQPPVNHGNRLLLPATEGENEWDRRSQLIDALLAPAAQYWQKHALKAPLSLMWQVSEAAQKVADWPDLITRAAAAHSLPLRDIELFPAADFSTWLSDAWDSPADTVQCLIFIDSADGESSEEAVSLLVASPALCRRFKLAPEARLLRPLLTPASTLSAALKVQCEQQTPAQKLATGWHCRLTDAQSEKIPLCCIEQKTGFKTGQLYATDSLLGVPGLARHATMITLAAECSGTHLLFTQHQGQFLLQQLHRLPGASA